MKLRKTAAFLLVLALLTGLIPAALAAHTHHWVLTATRVEPTCTQTGTGLYKCSCGKTKVDTIPALGHSWGSWITTQPETCGTAGMQTRTCSRCGKTETKAVPATGKHSFGSWKITQQVDCLVPGSMSRSCYTCGFTETRSIPAPGHNWGEGEITREATAAEEGEITYTCINNPTHIKKEAIPPTGEISPASGGPAPAVKGPESADSQPEITLKVSPDYELENYNIDNWGAADMDIGINVHIPETVACTGDTPLQLYRFVRYNDETDATWGSPSYDLFPVEINPPEKKSIPDNIRLKHRNDYYGTNIDHIIPTPDDPDYEGRVTLTIWYKGYPAGDESIDLYETEPLCESNVCTLIVRIPREKPALALEVFPDCKIYYYDVGEFGPDEDIGINAVVSEALTNTGNIPLKVFRLVRFNDETEVYHYSTANIFPLNTTPGNKEDVTDGINLKQYNEYYGEDIDHTLPVPEDPDCDWTATLTIWYAGFSTDSSDFYDETAEPLCESNKCVLTLRYPQKTAEPEAPSEPEPAPQPEPEPEPQPESQPEPGSQPVSTVRTFCSPELRCYADGSVEWILTRCPEHEAIARKASGLLQSAEGAEKEDARQAVIRLWTDAVNAEYDEMLAGADASAREIIEAEKAAFEAQLAAYSALSASDYPYAEASEILMHKAAMLCYENHTAPESRTDLRSGAAESAAGPGNTGSGLRRIAEQGSAVHVLEVLPPEYLSIEAAAADANDAESWKLVRQSWFGALERIVGEQYPEESGFRPAAVEALSTFTAWLDAREALLNLLYPGQPEAVQEILAEAIRARVLAMYCEK